MSESSAHLLTTIARLAKVFHAPDGRCYADIPVAQHAETWPVKSKRFKAWLSSAFYMAQQKPPPAQAMAEAVQLVEARALHGPEQEVHVRVANYDDKIYLDLVDAQWRAVEIDAAGWRIIPRAPVQFVRAGGMLALPAPVAGGDLDVLRSFLNVENQDTWRLIIHWLVMTLNPRGPYPPLGLYGEQGSGKSTVARVLRELVDPNAAPLRSEPREPRDLMIAAEHAWVVVLDNLSDLSGWLSDALCRLSTGGGFATRELYSDSDEVIFNAMRPVILTGIEEVVNRGDLMDRTIIVELPRIAPDRRRGEGQFWDTFTLTRPGLLGALLDAVAAGLRESSRVRLVVMPRMADFCLWSVAVEQGLGWPSGGFMTTYTESIGNAHEMVLDGDHVGQAVRGLMADVADGTWSGTASELLGVLNGKANETTKRSRAWPKSPRALSGALRRLAPNLRAVGVGVTFDRAPGGSRRRVVTLHVWESTVPAVPTVPEGAGIEGARDERDCRDARIPALTGPGGSSRTHDLWGVDEEGEL